MIRVIFSTLRDLAGCDAVDKNAFRVPTFYAPSNEGSEGLWFFVTIIIALLFGGIHCAGWNFPFPSHAELIIWRVSSLIILIAPCTPVLAMVEIVVDAPYTPMTPVTSFVIGFGMVIYVLARLTLFVEAFIALRHLPPRAYGVVEWTALLLHL